MDYSKMSLDELKEYAKSLDIKTGNIGKAKLIEKIQEAEKNKEYNSIQSVIQDDDLESTEPIENKSINLKKADNTSLIDSIGAAIDEMNEGTENKIDIVDDLPIDAIIPVKSITFGGLTYVSPSNNAIYRWNQIGDMQYMTIAELNEMNNFKREFLNKPYVILMNEKAVRKFRLTQVYEDVAKINNLKQVFSSDLQTIEKVIDDALEVNMRDILISKVRQMMRNKILTDINVIRLLERKLRFDFQDDI